MSKYKIYQIIKHALIYYMKRPEATEKELAEEQRVLDYYVERVDDIQKRHDIKPKNRRAQA